MTVPYEDATDLPNGGLLLPDPDATHGSPYAEGEECADCRLEDAKHKVGEEDARPGLHNYTAYLCCFCFSRVMGSAARRECNAVGSR